MADLSGNDDDNEEEDDNSNSTPLLLPCAGISQLTSNS